MRNCRAQMGAAQNFFLLVQDDWVVTTAPFQKIIPKSPFSPNPKMITSLRTISDCSGRFLNHCISNRSHHHTQSCNKEKQHGTHRGVPSILRRDVPFSQQSGSNPGFTTINVRAMERPEAFMLQHLANVSRCRPTRNVTRVRINSGATFAHPHPLIQKRSMTFGTIRRPQFCFI